MNAVTETLVPKLQTFAKSNNLSQDVFRALADRERAAARSDIDAIFRELEFKKKIELDYFKYLDVWKSLQDLGVGTLVHGRKGNPNRFVWHTNLREVGRLALGLPAEPEQLVKKEETKVMPPIKSQPKEGNTVTFVIPSTVSIEDIKALIQLGASLSK